MFDIPGSRLPIAQRWRIERHNQAELRRHINAFKPDVVSFWSMGGMSHSLIEATRRQGIPMVAFVHDEWLSYGRVTDQWLRLYRAPRRRRIASLVAAVSGVPTQVAYGSAGRYVFVSDFTRRAALKLPDPPVDHAVAHSGIDPLFITTASAREWRWRLLFVGRLDPKKGAEDAVAALALLPEVARLTIAGSWGRADEEGLGRVIESLGVSGRVDMLGQTSHRALAEIYRDHDVLLFPVRWDEPWGLVPLEAMAAGCPVIATGRGGSGEYLRDGDNCLLTPVENPPELAARVRRLAESPSLRQHLQRGGAETAPRHTTAIFNAAVEQHLGEMAGVTRPHRHRSARDDLDATCASST